MLDKIKSAIPLNWELMGNPVNWIILFLMVIFGALAISLITKAASGEGSVDNG